MKNHTAYLVKKLLPGRKLKRVAEVGVFKGANAEGLLDNLKIDLLIGVDPYERYPEFINNLSKPDGVVAKADYNMVKREMLQRMKPFGARFQLLEMYSVEASKMFDDETFDFVFIDGNHQYDYVIKDLYFWKPKVKVGGLLAGHDYVEKINNGVIQAVTEVFPDHNADLPSKIWWYEIPPKKEEPVVESHSTEYANQKAEQAFLDDVPHEQYTHEEDDPWP
jgi:hypothetical protein